MDFIEIAKNSKSASLEIADLSEEIKNKALLKIAEKKTHGQFGVNVIK